MRKRENVKGGAFSLPHLLTLSFSLLFVSLLHAQLRVGTNWNYDNERRFHFGFMIGANYSRINYEFSQKWYQQDTFSQVSSSGYPGFCLGAVANLHLGPTEGHNHFIREHFDIRFIPTLTLSQKRMYYTIARNNTQQFKDIESAIVEAPVLLKLKSDRLGDTRFYVVGGGKVSYDLSSDYKSARNVANPKLAIYPLNFSYEYGLGLDQYFKYFKWSPEIKVSKGISNLYVPDPTTYGKVFQRMRSNFIYFSMYFEG